MLLFGQFPRLLQDSYTVYLTFADAPGVTRDTPIRKSGILVGRVTQVALKDQGGVLVTAAIHQGVRLHRNEVPRIGGSLLGDAAVQFVQIPGRKGGDDVVQPGETLRGESAGGPLQSLNELELQRLIDSVTETSDQVGELARNLNRLVADNDDKITQVIDRLDLTLARLEEAAGTVNELLGDEELQESLKQTLADLPATWHHCKIINYLSGAAAGRFDILINNTPVAEKGLWRNAVPGTPLTRVGYQAHSSGPVPEYGRIDNLVITAAPEDPNAFPTPTITNVSPASYAVVPPTRSLQFEVMSVLPISASDISVLVNGSNVSSGLTVTGSPTDLRVSYGPLGLGRHTVEITATNGAGPTQASLLLYATENPITIFDSGGFTDDLLYPVGYLAAVTNADYYWAPAVEPSEIVDLSDGVHGKVLRRMQMGTDYTDYLHFSPVSAGTVIIDLDARVSSMEVRTLDLSLNSASTGGGTQGPFIMWGTNALNYYNRTAWVPVTALDADWHHVQMICYVSGPLGGTFDLKVDNALVGQGLVWRYVVSPVGTLRIGAIRGGVVQYGEVDNLVITAAPEPVVALPVALLNPVHTGSTFSFSFQTVQGLNYVVQHTAALGSGNWTLLETVTGDGSLKTIIHTNPPAAGLFYRVKSEVP